MKNKKTNIDLKTGMDRRSFIRLAGLGMMAISIPSRASNSSLLLPALLGTRDLGKLKVSSLGLGCMTMNGGQYNAPKDKKEMIRVIHQAVDSGVTFFDTAEAYGPFINEE
jgi:hypothetical protein